MGSADNRVLIVVPTYNERENIGPLASGVFAVLPGAHLLVIDDGSPDGTGDLVEAMGRTDPRVRLIRRPGKMGLGTAYVRGFEYFLAEGFDLVCEMDADLSHDPRDLPRFVDKAAEWDLTVGSRYVPGGGARNWGRMRRMISRGGNAYARAVLGCPFTDMTSGFRCYRRRALEALTLSDVRSEGYAFQIEMVYRLWRKGFRIGEIPIMFSERKRGQSKMSWGIFMEAVTGVWRMRAAI